MLVKLELTMMTISFHGGLLDPPQSMDHAEPWEAGLRDVMEITQASLETVAVVIVMDLLLALMQRSMIGQILQLPDGLLDPFRYPLTNFET